MKEQFQALYANLYLPVIVCRNAADLPVVYMNVRAGLLLSPTYSSESLQSKASLGCLQDRLSFASREEYEALCQMIVSMGHVDDYACEVVAFDRAVLPMALFGNCVTIEEPNDYFVIYLVDKKSAAAEGDSHLTAIINAAFLSDDLDYAIQTILGLAGEQAKVSRAYVFEEISPAATKNTYEWCAKGVAPVIQDLQELRKDEYPYETIIGSGMFISNDISQLPCEVNALLMPQGIKSLAILTLYDQGRPMGYVGFDDCQHCRHWSHDEIQFLQTAAALLTILIKRRQAEQKARRSQAALQLISDNSEDIIYANSIEDYTVKFVNKSLAHILGKSQEELVGKVCWEVFQWSQAGPCSNCPMPKVAMIAGEERSTVYTWENPNIVQGRTYLAKDNIIRWLDGEYVHVETATDISRRMDYEKQLHYYASTDAMTGIYNREWGGRELIGKLKDAKAVGSLCFLDVDGLKITNDRFGHDAGDALLVGTVGVIRQFMQEGELICRWGGDEFLLWLAGTVAEATVRIVAIQEEMERYNQTHDQPFRLSFSFGIVPFLPGPEATLDALVMAADELMYKNKMNKRGKSLKRRRDDV